MSIVGLIASDLDGTLLNTEGKLSQRTTAALRAAAAAGFVVAGATGRSHRSAVDLLAPVGVIRWVICSNGATLFDIERDEVVSHTYIPTSHVAEILAAGEQLPGLSFAWETPAGLFRDRAMTILMHRRYGPSVWSLEAEPPIHEVQEQLIKVMVGHPDLDHDELLAALRPLITNDLAVSSSGAAFIEITAAEAEKGKAVALLATELGVAQANTVAFGDQLNDLGMLGWVGRGYAMANAHPEVLGITPLRAPHHNSDGVAQVLEALVVDSSNR